MNDIRFGVNVHAAGDGFAAHARELESLGFDTIFLPDHLGMPAPFPALTAAAAATERVRVGTYVLNVGFWNTALLAREAATVDRLSGGRLVLGIGAGHMKSEFDMAGLAFEPFERRLAKLVDVVDDLDELLSSPDHAPQAVQRPRPPLLIGGTGDGVLTIAAQRADIFGLAGTRQLPGRPPGTFRLISAEETDERLAFFRSAAGPRAADIAIDVLVQRVEITDDRKGAAEKFAAELDNTLTPDEVLETPYVLFGTVEEIAEQVRVRAGRWGIGGFTVHQPAYAAMAKVIATMR
jgi:probable F420-dependent oxidoreductase